MTPNPPLFVLTGGPATGKSTTARALAARFPRSMHIPVDDVRDMVVSGQALPDADWSQALVEQLTLARQCVANMALAYQKAGFVVVVDDFWDPYSGLAEYAALFSHPQVRKILLYPRRDAARARNRQRSGPNASTDYIDGGIQLVYDHLDGIIGDLEAQGWRVLDTSELSVEDVVSRILAGGD